MFLFVFDAFYEPAESVFSKSKLRLKANFTASTLKKLIFQAHA